VGESASSIIGAGDPFQTKDLEYTDPAPDNCLKDENDKILSSISKRSYLEESNPNVLTKSGQIELGRSYKSSKLAVLDEAELDEAKNGDMVSD